MTTKQRILDAAERLFAQNGVEATSLRAITNEANVNLASVNYHFQSKDALVQAVIARRMGPINERRLALLEDCEAAAGTRRLPLDKVLEAFILPVLEFGAKHAPEFGPIMGRIYTEPKEFAEKIYKNHMEAVAQRFLAAFARALPELPEEELYWRLHFTFGAMAHTIGASHLLRLMSGGTCELSDVPSTMKRLETYMTAGLQAPVEEIAKCSKN
jgi:AcrR family transcriptional regulator